MVNDINTLNGSLSELGETMADNLVSMGVVDASASDGLTTLAGKILDIEPSIGGLDLDTAVTISSSESSISLGSSIVLTSKLTASYDDETIVDVDLSGVLQNATLIFKNGNTTIGTAVTDVNGVATFTYTPPAIGTLSLKAIFAGTDNFNNCESSFINVTVVAPHYDDIVLTADDSILSYYDGDSTTLRAQLMDGSSTASVSGVTVEFFNGSTSLGTAQTDSTGMATKTYTSTGAGDVSLKAEADNGTLSSETYVLEDCYFYDDCSTNKLSKYTTNLQSTSTATYTADGLLITGVGSHNYNQLQAPVTGVTGDVEFTVDVKGDWSNSHNHGLWIVDKLIASSDNYNGMNGYGLEIYGSNKGLIKYTNGSSSNISRTTPNLSNRTWYTFKFSLKNGTLTSTILNGGSSVFSNSTSYSYSFSILFLLTVWDDMKGYFKNVKVKPL